MPSDSLEYREVRLYRVEKPLKDAPFVGVLYDGEDIYKVLMLEIGWQYRYQRYNAEGHSNIDQLKPWRVQRIDAVIEGIGHVVFTTHNSDFKRCLADSKETSSFHPIFKGYPWPRGKESNLVQVLRFRTERFLQRSADRKYTSEELRWQSGFQDRVSELDWDERTWTLDEIDKTTLKFWHLRRYRREED